MPKRNITNNIIKLTDEEREGLTKLSELFRKIAGKCSNLEEGIYAITKAKSR